ncbi:putative ribonuclease H-like domain-containing protein [Tanacetum coccineum]
MMDGQSLKNSDYGLWQVIMNGDGPVTVTTGDDGVELKLHSIKECARSLCGSVFKSRFSVVAINSNLRRCHMNVFDKHQFEKFSVISTLRLLDKGIMLALIMRNKDGIDELDIDHLYKGSSGSFLNSQNVAFLSVEDTSSTNEVNTANGVSTTKGHNSQGQAFSSSYIDDLMFSFFASQLGSPQLDNKDLELVDHDDLEEMDLKWQVAILSMRVKQFYKKTERKLNFNSKEPIGYRSIDNTRRTIPVETSNALVTQDNALIVQDGLGLELVEAQLVVHQINEVFYEEKIAVLEFDVKDKDNAIIRLKKHELSEKDRTGLGYGDQLNEIDSSGSEVLRSVFETYSSDGDGNQTNDRFKKVDGYHAVPPPFTGNYMPPLADLSFAGLDDSVYRPTANKTSASMSQVETSNPQTSNTSVEMPIVESVRSSGVIIDDWVSDDEDVLTSDDLQTADKPSSKRIEFITARNESAKPDKQAEKPRIITQNPKVDRRNWNGQMTQKLGLGFGFTKKACFVCGSYNHLIKDCDFHEKRMAKESVLKRMGTGHREVRPVWNNAQRINHQNKFVLAAVLTRFGRIPISAAKKNSLKPAISTSPTRPVNTATPKRINTVKVNGVNTNGQAAVSAVEGKKDTAVKALACCVWRPKMIDLNNGNPQQAVKNKGIFESGCSRHMTGNKGFLTDYQEIDGGFVAFGRSTRGGKITGKGKIRTKKLDFEDVFFVKELKFNLFSVSQMCDKKNIALFTEIEFFVLSPDFKLLDESQVLLKVPRQSNMYSFDLKNVVPSRDLTCLFAKATLDQSNLWHMRLCYVIKTMNKLMKGNLVRGLPSKIFENDHTCVACQKGKQHKASCKAKLVSSISQPLQMLHMDLFGPTSVRSINHKTYCLVVTNDFSRDMNEFYRQKGIKREFSIARTPQQNGVVERKNMTLIEAARTMLADSFLPIVFWAEAVNTACYVLNRVLLTKPHNKTPYELIIGRPPSISFMIPFGCPVTILNTIDPLGKFDRKAKEGFLVGYSMNSKAFKVFNSETRKVEENLYVNFLENKPNVAG